VVITVPTDVDSLYMFSRTWEKVRMAETIIVER
jgi:hypothetical protein